MIFNSLHLDIRFGIYILYFNIYTKGYLNIKSLDNNFFFFFEKCGQQNCGYGKFCFDFSYSKNLDMILWTKFCEQNFVESILCPRFISRHFFVNLWTWFCIGFTDFPSHIFLSLFLNYTRCHGWKFVGRVLNHIKFCKYCFVDIYIYILYII